MHVWKSPSHWEGNGLNRTRCCWGVNTKKGRFHRISCYFRFQRRVQVSKTRESLNSQKNSISINGICSNGDNSLTASKIGFNPSDGVPIEIEEGSSRVEFTLLKVSLPRLLVNPQSKIRFIGQSARLCCSGTLPWFPRDENVSSPLLGYFLTPQDPPPFWFKKSEASLLSNKFSFKKSEAKLRSN